jgi:hypothetical protein
MELVVLNAGYDLGVIPKLVFVDFVIMAIVATYMTVPVLRLLFRGTRHVKTNSSRQKRYCGPPEPGLALSSSVFRDAICR